MYFQWFLISLLQQIPTFTGFLLGTVAYHCISGSPQPGIISPFAWTLIWGVWFSGMFAAAKHWIPYGGVSAAVPWVFFMLGPVGFLVDAWRQKNGLPGVFSFLIAYTGSIWGAVLSLLAFGVSVAFLGIADLKRRGK